MTKTTNAVTLMLAVTLSAAAPDLRADDDPVPAKPAPSVGKGVIVSLGLGAGPGDADPTIAGVASAQFRRGSKLFGIRTASSAEFNLFGPSPAASDTEYGVLFGGYRPGKAGYLSASAGLSVVNSVRRGRYLRSSCDDSPALFGCFFETSYYEKVVSRTIGVPFEVKAVLSSRHAGLGISLMGDLSPKTSFVAVALVFEMGSLR